MINLKDYKIRLFGEQNTKMPRINVLICNSFSVSSMMVLYLASWLVLTIPGSDRQAYK